jgi:hypothetical protein
VVNSLNDYEDRIFPAASNVPCVHVSSDSPISQRDISAHPVKPLFLKPSVTAIQLQCLEFYKEIGWIGSDCELSARPAGDSSGPKDKKQHQEEDMLSRATNILQMRLIGMGIWGWMSFTPLWNASEKDCFVQQRIGISISEVHEDGFSSNHHTPRPSHSIGAGPRPTSFGTFRHIDL